MDAKAAISIAKLIEASLKGDAEAVSAYASQLKDRLTELGDSETAERIQQSLGGKKAKKAGITRIAPPRGSMPIPVDSESRLDVADEFEVQKPVPIRLCDETLAVIDRFISSVKNAEKLAERGVNSSASLLMFGPPGCGKTLAARYIAHKLNLPLLVARSDSLISSYLGSTSKNLRMLFEHAAARRCVLFLDEFDAIAKMRDDQRELGELKRVVISLLQNIDASGDDCVLIAATNHEHLLDPAVWRRFSHTISVGLPDEKTRTAMLCDFLGDSVPKATLVSIAKISEGMTGAKLRSLADEVIRESVLQDTGCPSSETLFRLAASRMSDCQGLTTEDAIRLIRRHNGKNVSQAELGKMFGISQATVNRILKTEKANGRSRSVDGQNGRGA